MDLRRRANFVQRVQEAVIRFRFPLLLLLLLPWWFFASAWRDVVGALLAQAERNAMVVSSLWAGSVGNPMDWLRFGCGILLLALIRWRIMGIRAMLTLFASFAVVITLCWWLDGSAMVLPAILGVMAVGIVTLFFFAKNAWGIGALAFCLVLYGVAAWISGMVHGQLGIGWQVLVGLAATDLLAQIALIRSHLRAGHTKAGAIVKAGSMASLSAVVSWVVLLILDLACHFLQIPTMLGGTLLTSQLSALGYVIGVAILAPVLLSLSPFGRIQAKSRTLANS